MMLLPIGHEEDSVRRWPWVTIVIAVLCVLFHLVASTHRDTAEQRVIETLTIAIEYYHAHPHLELDPRLRIYVPSDVPAPAPDLWAAAIVDQQRELDRLTAAHFESLAEVPEHRWGLVPAKPRASAFFTSMFTHGGWVHLLGNLFFLWLAGPPLEDRWGRPLFAAFYLLCGLVGGLLWVSRYPDSLVPLVGASGAIAGLMGAFAVRFWSTRIRFFYFFWWLLPPKIFSGTFQAPAWIMLGLWFGRELFWAGATDQFMAAIGGGTAYWVHVWGFGFGLVLAGGLRYLKLEEKVLAPQIETKLGTSAALVNEPLEEAHRLRQEGRTEEAWQTLRTALAKKIGDADTALALWDLGRQLDRTREAAAPVLQAIRYELRRGENDLALAHWQELSEHLGELPIDLDLRLRLAEACLKERCEEDAAELLAEVHGNLDPQLPVGLLIRLARTAAGARSASAPALLKRVLDRTDLPPEVRAELLDLREQLRVFGLRPRRSAVMAAPAEGPIPLS